VLVAAAVVASGAFATNTNVGPGAPLPDFSAFVLGDVTVAGAAAGDTVTWWSHSWWKENTVMSGPVDPNFKGFTGSLPASSPRCGDTWTTTGGNSPHPPATVPPVMQVIVSSSITSSGETITGNIAKIVTVATDPGYDPNPGHPGTGRIIATITCGE
jgi:hypothetical protein